MENSYTIFEVLSGYIYNSYYSFLFYDEYSEIDFKDILNEDDIYFSLLLGISADIPVRINSYEDKYKGSDFDIEVIKVIKEARNFLVHRRINNNLNFVYYNYIKTLFITICNYYIKYNKNIDITRININNISI